MLLLLVRHALTPITGKRLTGWLPGFHLSDEGKKQATSVADRLSALPISAVYSSPLERCHETATEVAGRHGLGVELLDAIGEVRYGDWQGRTFKSLYKMKAWGQLRARPADFRFPGGETIREAQTRAVAAVEDLLKKHRGDVVAAVSHADLIRLVLAAYIGLPIDSYSRLVVGAASVSAISFEDVPRMLLMSEVGSLENLAERLKHSKTAVRTPRPASAPASKGNAKRGTPASSANKPTAKKPAAKTSSSARASRGTR